MKAIQKHKHSKSKKKFQKGPSKKPTRKHSSSSKNFSFKRNASRGADFFSGGRGSSNKVEDEDKNTNDVYSSAAGCTDGKKNKKKKMGGGGGAFGKLGLKQNICYAVQKLGYKQPTPIQRKCIPEILNGGSIVAMARTGSGKTAAFLLPMIHMLDEHSFTVGARGLILSPTRELALQIGKQVRLFSYQTNLRLCLLIGGNSMEEQFSRLAANPDIIVATPGRLVHHIVETKLNLTSVRTLVVDEADRLFELGFSEQLKKIWSALGANKQTVFTSATLPIQLVEFLKQQISAIKFFKIDSEQTISDKLTMEFLYCRQEEKLAALLMVVRKILKRGEKAAVFVATRHHVEFCSALLRKCFIEAAGIYGNLDQTERIAQLKRFRTGLLKVLIVTDVAARGLDIPTLENVVNFDFPSSPKLFIHRVGRTARAGRSGLATTIITREDMPYAIELMLHIGGSFVPISSALPLACTSSGSVCTSNCDENIDSNTSVEQALSSNESGCNNGGDRAADASGEMDNYNDSSNRRGVYVLGSVPDLCIDTEFIEKAINEDPELSAFLKSMQSAYNLYRKTRKEASKESCRRAYEFFESCGGVANLLMNVHPSYKSYVVAEKENINNILKTAAESNDTNCTSKEEKNSVGTLTENVNDKQPSGNTAEETCVKEEADKKHHKDKKDSEKVYKDANNLITYLRKYRPTVGGKYAALNPSTVQFMENHKQFIKCISITKSGDSNTIISTNSSSNNHNLRLSTSDIERAQIDKKMRNVLRSSASVIPVKPLLNSNNSSANSGNNNDSSASSLSSSSTSPSSSVQSSVLALHTHAHKSSAAANTGDASSKNASNKTSAESNKEEKTYVNEEKTGDKPPQKKTNERMSAFEKLLKENAEKTARHMMRKQKLKLKNKANSEENKTSYNCPNGVSVSDVSSEKRKQFFLSDSSTLLSGGGGEALDCLDDTLLLHASAFDMTPDEQTDMKRTQHFMRWNPQKKKYMLAEVDSLGRKVKTRTESGKVVKGEVQETGLYEKWASTSKRRIQSVGETENSNCADFSKKRKREADKEREEDSDSDDDGAPPLAANPKHAALLEAARKNQPLTNKQKRQLKKLKTQNSDSNKKGNTTKELKDPQQISKLKKQREKAKLRQDGKARKRILKAKKATFMKKQEAKLAQRGAKNRSIMICNTKQSRKKRH